MRQLILHLQLNRLSVSLDQRKKINLINLQKVRLVCEFLYKPPNEKKIIQEKQLDQQYSNNFLRLESDSIPLLSTSYKPQVQSNQYLSEMDEQSNSYMISPYPLGLLELRANLSSRNEICFNNQALTLDT